MKGKHLLLMVLFIGILMSSLSLVSLANAQQYRRGVYFDNVTVIQIHPEGKYYKPIDLTNGGTAKVYDNDNLYEFLSFYDNENNENLSLTGTVYIYENIDNELRFTDNRSVAFGFTGNSIWTTKASDPGIHHWKVELWWENNILEDSKEFDMWVVKLFVENWSPAPLTVEKGKTAPSSWSINFKNGGNDGMENVSISVVDLAELQITPTSQNLGNIIAGGTKSTSFSVTAPFTLPVENRTVKFQITYYDFMGISHTETMSAPVNVDRLSTSITLSVDPSSVKKDSSCTITAKLVNANGDPVANQEISFSVGTTSIGSENTYSSGKATQIFVANVDAGTYAISASFAGAVDYKPSKQTTNLTVEPFKTTLVLDIVPSSATLGDKVTIKAILKDEKGIPLPNENVEFQINDKTIDSATTDSNGVASIQYKTSIAGTLDVKAVFAGETNYENSSTIAKLVVNTSRALQVGIVALVVIVVLVGLVFFAMRRGMKMPSMWRKEGTTLPHNP